MKSPKLSDIGEIGLIRSFRHQACTHAQVIHGIGDDAAVLDVGTGKYLLLTTDMLCEGVHFERAMKPDLIGRKSLACNISDIAAMGGRPTCAVISFGAPSSLPAAFAKGIFRGINRLAAAYHVALVGGDMIRSDKIVLNIALLGEVSKKELVLRSKAKPGDKIFVTGPLGRSFITGKHLTFTPRLKEASALVKHYKPTSMIDLSDGLISDLGHIIKESRVGAVLEAKKIPRNKGATLNNAFYDGEDFELLFTLRPVEARKLSLSRMRFQFYEIGSVLPSKQGLRVLSGRGRIEPVSLKGFVHF